MSQFCGVKLHTYDRRNRKSGQKEALYLLPSSTRVKFLRAVMGELSDLQVFIVK